MRRYIRYDEKKHYPGSAEEERAAKYNFVIELPRTIPSQLYPFDEFSPRGRGTKNEVKTLRGVKKRRRNEEADFQASSRSDPR